MFAPSFTGQTALPTITALFALTAGTMFLVWLGELITENGIGNGISVIIFGGIVAGMPGLVNNVFNSSVGLFGVAGLAVLAVLLVAAIVFMQEAVRKIPVQYAKSVFRAGKMYRQSGQSHIPLRVNSAGMIPLIFAFSIVILPATAFAVRPRLIGHAMDPQRRAVLHQHVLAGHGRQRLERERRVLHRGVRARGGVQLLLHARDVPAAEPGGEPAEAGRLRAGHPARAADGRVHHAGAGAHHVGGRDLPRRRRGDPVPGDGLVRRAVR